MRPGAYRRSIKTGDVAARMGTQRARSRTPSVKTYRSCVPLAHGRQVCAPGRTGEASKRATLRRGWGHSGLDPELLLSILSSLCPPGAWQTGMRPGAYRRSIKTATLRRGWGHSGLDPELLRSRFIVAVSPWRMADRYAPRGVQAKPQNGRRCGADGDTAGSIPNSFGQDLS